MTNLQDCTQRELESKIFEGASVSEFRSPSDAFTIDEMVAIVEGPAFEYFDSTFRFWMYNAIEAALED